MDHAIQMQKPNFRVGQYVKMINCPDAVLTPNRLWTIRTEPFWFEGQWRVLLSGWIGSFPVENIAAVNFDESGGASS